MWRRPVQLAPSNTRGLEALQLLLSLAASDAAKLNSAEDQRVLDLLIVEMQMGNFLPLAWFVHVAGRVTSLYAQTLVGSETSLLDALQHIESTVGPTLNGKPDALGN